MYNRTRNKNGSHSSRCLDCFLTIASSLESDADLDAIEARHICPEKVLSWLTVEAAVEKPAQQRSSGPAQD